MRTKSGDIGGTFFGRDGAGKDLDRTQIVAWGFTILEERSRAGRTSFIVHGGNDQAQFILLNRVDIQCSLPFTLYSLPENREVNIKLVFDSNQGFSEL